MSMKSPEDYYPEFLRDLAERIARHLVDTEVCTPEKSAAIGRSLADQVCDDWQGQVVNVPKAALYKVRVRWNQMWEEFNGSNHADLARKYGMGVKQVYKVLKHMQAYHRARGADLFAQATQAAQAQQAASQAAPRPNTTTTGAEEHVD